MMTIRLIADFDNTLSDALNGVTEAEAALGRMYRAALARVAELEAQLAAQWRPVTEKPLVAMQYQVVVQHSRQQPTADHMAYYPSSGWTGTDVIYWRPIPPLPPAPQETE